MTLAELFDTCNTGEGYNQTAKRVDWKIVDGIMFFRQSVEREDWIRNLLAAIPIVVWLKGFEIVPLGAWLTFLEVRKIAGARVTGYVGYSQGGWPAVYASRLYSRPAIVFGCPRSTLCPGKYKDVTAYTNPGDVVTTLPPWANEAGEVVMLGGYAERPDDCPVLEWASGHSPDEYRQRLV